MVKYTKDIAILEPSEIIYEGLSVSISGTEFNVHRLQDLESLDMLNRKRQISMVLINPGIVQNMVKGFIRMKKQFPDIKWIGIIYAFYDPDFLRNFDQNIQITDNISDVLHKINLLLENKGPGFERDEQLSERETDVLKCLADGLSNKETADKLNISVHTVISHRKNIMDKTGIRSLPGLTIYAYTKGIVFLQ